MKACIGSGFVSVFVNGSPIEDFNVKRGLRQRDPLALFLFLFVTEGLAGMVRSVVEKGHFVGYLVNDNIFFLVFQFADDTIMLCEASRSNLWTIKTIFLSFELVSGLRVNFFKSCLFGVNTYVCFLNSASEFLFCHVGKLRFKFLGIPIAASPRRCSTWDPIVLALMKKLQSWRGCFLSISGRVTLINSMLNSLPLYFFLILQIFKKSFEEY